MENIKIYDFTNGSIAIDVKQADNLSKTIIQRYNSSHSKVSIDFWDIQSLISPFMRALLKPLVINKIDFEWINFTSSRSKDIYSRVLKELSVIWTENIRELNI